MKFYIQYTDSKKPSHIFSSKGSMSCHKCVDSANSK